MCGGWWSTHPLSLLPYPQIKKISVKKGENERVRRVEPKPQSGRPLRPMISHVCILAWEGRSICRPPLHMSIRPRLFTCSSPASPSEAFLPAVKGPMAFWWWIHWPALPHSWVFNQTWASLWAATPVGHTYPLKTTPRGSSPQKAHVASQVYFTCTRRVFLAAQISTVNTPRSCIIVSLKQTFL